ncbi:MAG: threonylcarbamoyl-AMP synthase [Clostridiales bacterium]|nr:threonylcarbamoyl-AMP synthase [Clostridiales bacterium]
MDNGMDDMMPGSRGAEHAGNAEKMVYQTNMVFPQDEIGFRAAAEALANGEVVGMPTETVYGLGADARNPEAVKKIYEAKGRPSDNPLIVHVANKDMIHDLVSEITPIAQVLIDAFMPGPITIVMKKSSLVPDCVSAGLDTVGVRFPVHPVAQRLIAASGVPVAAPSANLSGSPSPTKAEHVMKDMDGRIPYIVDGGECQVGLESTVVDATGNWPQILRPGAVTIDDMEEALAAAGIEKPEELRIHEASPDEAPRAPGMKYRHYAPRCEVKILGDGTAADFDNYFEYYKQTVMQALLEDKTPVGLFLGEEIADRVQVLFANRKKDILYYIYGATENVEKASHHLFDGLRTLDEAGAKMIVAPAFPEEGLGIAYMNRLNKAAAENEELLQKKSHRSVMFVCSGNTCRSPMAEAIFRSIFRSTGPHHMIDHPEIEAKVDSCSAGAFASGDEPYTIYTVRIAKYEYDEDLSSGYSHIAIKERLVSQDLVLCMTDDHSRFLRERFPDLSDRIFSFQEFLDDLDIPNVDGDVADPYGGDYLVYMDTAKQLDRIIRVLMPEILKKWGME